MDSSPLILPEDHVRYTPQMRGAVDNLKHLKPYPDLAYAIVEWPNMLTIRVWENNIMKYRPEQYLNILEYLELVKKTLRSFNVSCEIEGVKGDPPTKRR